MKSLLLVITIIVMALITFGGYYFLYPKPIPKASEIRTISIFYSPNEDVDKVMRFELDAPDQVKLFRDVIGSTKFRRLPLLSPDYQDGDRQWVINIHLENSELRFFIITDSHSTTSIYKHLVANFTQQNQI